MMMVKWMVHYGDGDRIQRWISTIEIYDGDGDDIEDETRQILEITKTAVEIVNGYGDEVVRAW